MNNLFITKKMTKGADTIKVKNFDILYNLKAGYRRKIKK